MTTMMTVIQQQQQQSISQAYRHLVGFRLFFFCCFVANWYGAHNEKDNNKPSERKKSPSTINSIINNGAYKNSIRREGRRSHTQSNSLRNNGLNYKSILKENKWKWAKWAELRPKDQEQWGSYVTARLLANTHTHATARQGEMDVAEALNARDYKGLGRAVGSMGWGVGLVAVVVVVCPVSLIVFCDEAKKK